MAAWQRQRSGARRMASWSAIMSCEFAADRPPTHKQPLGCAPSPSLSVGSCEAEAVAAGRRRGSTTCAGGAGATKRSDASTQAHSHSSSAWRWPRRGACGARKRQNCVE